MTAPQEVKVKLYCAKLPDDCWLNLAQIRSLRFDREDCRVEVVWQNGDREYYYDGLGVALVDAWNAAFTNPLIPPDEA